MTHLDLGLPGPRVGRPAAAGELGASREGEALVRPASILKGRPPAAPHPLRLIFRRRLYLQRHPVFSTRELTGWG